MKIPKRLTKAANRSGTMPCDICGAKDLLHIHHIEGQNIPNPNHPSNTCSICPSCHYKVHYGKITVEKWIQTTSGKELLWHLVGEESFSGQDSEPYIIKAQ